MEDLRTEAIRTSKERAERRRLEQEQQGKEAAEQATQSLTELISARLEREVDAAQIQIIGRIGALCPAAVATVDNVRLMSAPTPDSSDFRSQDSGAQSYGLFVLSHCQKCQDADVVSDEIHEVADVGDFLQQKQVCPTCIEDMAGEAGTVHISSFSDF